MPSQKIIFLSLVQINTLDVRGIYQDLLRQFVEHGNEVTIVCPVERRAGLNSKYSKIAPLGKGTSNYFVEYVASEGNKKAFGG
jgi:hypothetical protein